MKQICGVVDMIIIQYQKITVWCRNVDIDKYKYSGYGIGFDRCGTFSVAN